MPHPSEAQVVEALSIGAVILGERHNDPAARNMAVRAVQAKKVRWLLVEALGDERNQREVLKCILDQQNSKISDSCWTSLMSQGSGDTWLPVLAACVQQRTPIVFADFSPKKTGPRGPIRLSPTSDEGMAMRDNHMAAQVNVLGNIEMPGTTRGQGVLLVCGNDHVAGVVAGVSRFPVASFDFT